MSAEAAVGVEPALLVDPQARVIDYLRVSVTDRCNYGCSYCIPHDGVEHADRADVLSFEEIAALVRVFVSLGVRRVRLTGGEPTVRRDLAALVRMLRAIPGLAEIALSSNGHLLAELAAPLRAAGVDRLNISLDSLDAERFRRITRRGDLGRVLAGIEAARAAGFASIKLNTVAIRGFNDDELAGIAGWAWQRGLVPRFIEQMPMASGLATVAFGILFGGFISGLLCKRSIYLLQCGRQLLAGYVIALAPLLESMAAVALFLTIVAGMSALGGLYYPEIALPIAAALLILAGGIAYTRQLLVRLQRSV